MSLWNDPQWAEAGLTAQCEGAVVTLTLSRPDKGNALSAALVAALQSALDTAVAQHQQHPQDPVRLLVLRGDGKHFCTGFDLSNLDEETDDTLLSRFTRVELLLQSVARAPFATLALAQGRTMGAGADLLAACTHRWAVGELLTAFPGAAFGLVLGTARLTDTVGAVVAQDWIESGRTVGSAEMLAAGLLSQTFADAQAAEQALAALLPRVQRLEADTQAAIHAAIASARWARGPAGDAQDLQRLVLSAARPGIRARIAAYREAQTRARPAR